MIGALDRDEHGDAERDRPQPAVEGARPAVASEAGADTLPGLSDEISTDALIHAERLFYRLRLIHARIPLRHARTG